jgi:hypothetical protein
MNGQAHWAIGLVLFLGAATVLLLPTLLAWFQGSFRRVERRVACPETGGGEDTLLVRNERTGHYTGVARCSKFEDPTEVRCDHACLQGLNHLKGARTLVH